MYLIRQWCLLLCWPLHEFVFFLAFSSQQVCSSALWLKQPIYLAYCISAVKSVFVCAYSSDSVEGVIWMCVLDHCVKSFTNNQKSSTVIFAGGFLSYIHGNYFLLTTRSCDCSSEIYPGHLASILCSVGENLHSVKMFNKLKLWFCSFTRSPSCEMVSFTVKSVYYNRISLTAGFSHGESDDLWRTMMSW